jgi:uncharacterized protein YdiU (UPF0061 family)
MNLDNSYARLPERFFAEIEPQPATRPELLAWNAELADELGLSQLGKDAERAAQIFGGGPLPDEFAPIALAYAGHQFGQFVPQLGDGRAVLIGEVLSRSGRRYDIQLKGSGRTPFSRGGDGRSWLGPVIREYLVSEAMHVLGVPTTRALAAVATGETVIREGRLPGGVFTRVASSHLRVGSFEYFAARKDLEGLQTLADYAIDRHYPQARDADTPLVAFFRGVVQRQAELVSHWMSIGFIHGVMNTDNTSISGETIDYGPCAFMDEFRFDKVFSSIDHRGRYAYANQPHIAIWNLARLAECLLLICDNQPAFEEALEAFSPAFRAHWLEKMRAKLGIAEDHDRDDDAALVDEWLGYLQDNELDFTLSFRELADRAGVQDETRFGEFEEKWRQRVLGQGRSPDAVARAMNTVNPLFIPRNHRIEEAIQQAVAGDTTMFNELRTLLAKPFDEQPTYARYAEPPEPAQRVTQTFCGT